jgi:hypothetical protein
LLLIAFPFYAWVKDYYVSCLLSLNVLGATSANCNGNVKEVMRSSDTYFLWLTGYEIFSRIKVIGIYSKC